MNRQKIFNVVNKICNYLPTRKIPRLSRKYAARILNLKDYSLSSGERQTSKTLDGIRVDHTARYGVATDFLQKYFKNKPIKGYDVFCGIGYGAYMLSNAMPNATLEAIDGSDDAIKLAQKHYQTGRITFYQKFFPFELSTVNADFFISLESIEHIEDDTTFLNLINKTLKPGGILIISTPNLEKWPLENNPNHFHYRHYKPSEFIQDIESKGFKLLYSFGQNIYKMNKKGEIQGVLEDKDMEVKADYEGQNCIYIFQRNDE